MQASGCAFLSSRKSSYIPSYFIVLALAIGIVLSAFLPAAAQQSATVSASAQQPLITSPIDESQLTTLHGNTHPLARPEFDLGTAQASLPLRRMLLVLKRSPQQEYSLRKMLDDQQDKKSATYHKWLTPTEFGQQFGPTDQDMQTITAWLQSYGFEVGSTKGRTVLEFSGSASQVQEAFHTTIHKYLVNGEQHWANASDPSIPTALTPAVAGVLTLHNFIKKPTIHFTGEKIPAKVMHGKKPQVTFPPRDGQAAVNALGPLDYATIYNINPLYSFSIGGYEERIAIVGRSDLYYNGQDVANFANVFEPNGFAGGYMGVSIVLNGPDPGDLGGGEEAEATLDSTWSSALAPGAEVQLVVSATTNTTDGIDLSENYIIENNLAGVMTESFSACELYATDAQLAGATAMAEQAAAQGITYLVSTGDDGAEGCDDPDVAPATHPISVNFLASTAFNVAVGGTMFNENGDTSKYWTSAAPFAETAISYIPEDVWNESSLTNGLWAGSGGASAGNIASGVGTTPGVPKPTWQYGVTGIPSDGVRDLPDVSLTAAGHDPYLLCLEGSCIENSEGEIGVYFISGTSASTPSFAAIMALAAEEQTHGGRLGLANYILYRLAATQSAYPAQCNGSNTATAPASACIFNDVTVGNNVVPGEAGADYQASAGYDLASGLGSVNVANLVNQWGSVTFNPTTTTLSVSTGTPMTHGSPIPFTVTVTPYSGTEVPTGNVSLFAGSSPGVITSLGFWTLSGGSVSSEMDGLPGGTYGPGINNILSAYYAGDTVYAPSASDATYSFTIDPEPSTTTVSILTANQNGQAVPFTGGPFGSFVYVRADVAGQSGHGTPTGTVTFTDSFGVIPGGSTAWPLNSEGNTAIPGGIYNFDTGTHTISASYSGDTSFNASSATASQSFTITPGFFAQTASGQGAVVIGAPGGSGQGGVNVFYSTGFTGTISLACSGLPSESTCRFVPPTITATGTSSMTESAIVVSTTAATSQKSARNSGFGYWTVGLGIFCGVLLAGGQRRRGAQFLPVLLALLVLLPSCGGGGGGGGNSGPPPNPGTPTGNYNVTVSATSGSTTSTAGFVLVVQ